MLNRSQLSRGAEAEISPAYLSYMVKGKRPWGAELRERYLEFVNTFVNSPSEAGYENTGDQEGIRTPTPVKGKRILSRSRAHPPAGNVRLGIRFPLTDKP